MKSIITFFVFAASQSALALPAFNCKGSGSSPTDLSVTLTALSQNIEDVAQGTQVPYRLAVHKAGKEWVKLDVKAQQEDVLFGFEGNSRKAGHVVGQIPVDELDQASLFIFGQNFDLDCSRNL